MKKLVRSRTNRKLAGVCGGIADYFGVDPTMIRIITLVLFFVTWFFPVPIAYLVLTFILPNEGDTTE